MSETSHKNLDPITGTPGAHPIGVGVGATTGGLVAGAALAAGAATGTLAAGPIGTVVGAAVGAVIGGLGGKAVAERIDPTDAADYWRDNHAKQPYYAEGMDYEQYESAYRIGGQPRERYANMSFDEAEPHLATEYEGVRGDSGVSWDHGRHAARAAWDRVSAN